MASSARIDELRKKFEENPRRYFAPLANEYRKAGDIEQAISICREYLPQQPGHMSGHIVYGQALYEARQYEEARSVFETALALDPENLIALRHLGDIALIVGDIGGARTWYGRVLEADPRNEEIQAQLKSLDSLTSAAPTPMSTPALPPPSTAPAAPPPAASSAATVAVPTMPLPAVERTVELPSTAVPSLVPQSLSTAPTTEITIDQVPIPAVPDLEKVVAPEAPGAEPPVEKAVDFEATAVASVPQEPPVGPPSELETTAAPTTEVPDRDSFTLEGLETTSMTERTPADITSTASGTSGTPSPERPADSEPTAAPAPASAEPPALSDLELAAPAAEATAEPAAEAAVATEGAAPPAPPAAETAAPERPASSGELPFLDLGETAPPASVAEAPPQEPAPEPVAAMAESKPFVTETMAELYEQQGHREEALRVYLALLEQRPNDEHIRARIEQLQGRRGPTIRELLARVASRRPKVSRPAAQPSMDGAGGTSPAKPIESTPAPSTQALPTSEAALPLVEPRLEPAVETPPRQPGAAPATGPLSRRDTLGELFGSPGVSGADENAAVTLAAAFSSDRGENGNGSATQLGGTPARPASRDLSLDAVFGGESSRPPASSFSFDQFFSQRATAEHPTAGARSGLEGAGQETKDDVAKFTQWLEGLKQR